MSSNADELRSIPKYLPDTGNTEDTKPDFDSEYINRMKREGLMDEQGVWLPRAIKEATK